MAENSNLDELSYIVVKVQWIQ